MNTYLRINLVLVPHILLYQLQFDSFFESTTIFKSSFASQFDLTIDLLYVYEICFQQHLQLVTFFAKLIELKLGEIYGSL